MVAPKNGEMVAIRCAVCRRLIRNAGYWDDDGWTPLWRAPGGTPHYEPRLLAPRLPNGARLVDDGRQPLSAGECRRAGAGEDPQPSDATPAARYRFTCRGRRHNLDRPVTHERLQRLCGDAYRTARREVLL